MKTIPDNADPAAWEAFEAWCDSQTDQIGDHPDDYGPWWQCYAAAFCAGRSDRVREENAG